MPKPFSERERESIRRRLLDAGEECWGRFGVKRTNVDDLAQLAGISKGTFYLFFATKELFFMEVLERYQQRIKQRLLHALRTETGGSREKFVRVTMELYDEVKDSRWLLNLMGGDGEYDYLVRKLPPERVQQHIVGDDQDAVKLLALFGIDDRATAETVSAALRGLFLLLLHGREIGAAQTEPAFRLLLEGLALRLFGGHDD